MKTVVTLGSGLAALGLGLFVVAAAPRAPMPVAQSGPEGYHVSKTVPLPGDSGWDYLSEDPANRRLYINHGNEVVVVNMDNDRVVGTIGDLHGIHGTAISDKDGHGFTTNGGNQTITMFDIKTLAKIKSIPAPKTWTASSTIPPPTASLPSAATPIKPSRWMPRPATSLERLTWAVAPSSPPPTGRATSTTSSKIRVNCSTLTRIP